MCVPAIPVLEAYIWVGMETNSLSFSVKGYSVLEAYIWVGMETRGDIKGRAEIEF